MENAEIQQNQTTEHSNLVLSKESIDNLTETRKWTMFFSILGFIAIGFMMLAGLIFSIIGLVGGGFGGFNEGYIITILAVVYIVLGGLYILPILYLLKFSTHMKKAIEQSVQNDLTLAFKNLKAHYRFIGILTIALFGIYILAAIIIGLVGVTSMF